MSERKCFYLDLSLQKHTREKKGLSSSEWTRPQYEFALNTHNTSFSIYYSNNNNNNTGARSTFS